MEIVYERMTFDVVGQQEAHRIGQMWELSRGQRKQSLKPAIG